MILIPRTNQLALSSDVSPLAAIGNERIEDFKWASASSILMPGSKIAIGTGGLLGDAELYESGNLTFDFANGTGDNGLDTGSEAASQWYALYAVPGVGTAYKLKATTRHPISAPGPSGQTKWRYLGVFRNGYDTSVGQSDIAQFVKSRNRYLFSYRNNLSSTGFRIAVSSNFASVYLDTINLTLNSMSGLLAVPFTDTWASYHAVLSPTNTSVEGGIMILGQNSSTSINPMDVSSLKGPQTFYNAVRAKVDCMLGTTDHKVDRFGISFALTTGTASYSLLMNSLIDPLLGRS